MRQKGVKSLILSLVALVLLFPGRAYASPSGSGLSEVLAQRALENGPEPVGIRQETRSFPAVAGDELEGKVNIGDKVILGYLEESAGSGNWSCFAEENGEWRSLYSEHEDGTFSADFLQVYQSRFTSTIVPQKEGRFKVIFTDRDNKSAQWILESLRPENGVVVTFDPTGGEVDRALGVFLRGQPYGELPQPRKEGFVFDGWYDSVTEGSRVTEETPVERSEDHTLFAGWADPDPVSVRLHPNGGTIGLDTIELMDGRPYGELPFPEKKGYIFEGWYTDSEAGSLRIGPSSIFYASSVDTLYANWIESVSGKCGDEAFFTIEGTTLTIEGTGEMADYLYDFSLKSFTGHPWTDYIDYIYSINIREGITHTGDGAFAFHENVREVRFPRSLKSIGEDGFAVCTSLKSVKLPGALDEIDIGAFYSCSALEYVDVSAGVRVIRDLAFQDCGQLAFLDLSDDLEEIGEFCFASDYSLVNAALPETVKSIGDAAFFGCASLQSFVIPKGIKSITDTSLFLGIDGFRSLAFSEMDELAYMFNFYTSQGEEFGVELFGRSLENLNILYDYEPNTKTLLKEDEYIVTLNPCGGSINADSDMNKAFVIVSAGGTYRGLPEAPKAYDEDYCFNGWYTERYGGTRIYNNISRIASESDHTLYAHFISLTGDKEEESEAEGESGRSGLDNRVYLFRDNSLEAGTLVYTGEMVKGQSFSFGPGSWSSNQPRMVSVDKKSGMAKAIAEGSAVLTNVTAEGVEEYRITVRAPSLSVKKLVMTTGEERRVALDNAGNLPQTWISSDPLIIRVDYSENSKGASIVALGTGSAKVTAYVGGKAFVLTVKTGDASTQLSDSSLSGRLLKLNAFQTVNPGYDKGFKAAGADWAEIIDGELRPLSRDNKGNSTDSGNLICISKNGRITGTGVGKVSVLGTSVAGAETALNIEISAIPSKSVIYLNKGQKTTLKHTYVTNTEVEWSAADESLLTLLNTGRAKVTIKAGDKTGRTTVTCKYKGVDYQTTVYVEDPELLELLREDIYKAVYVKSMNEGDRFFIRKKYVMQAVTWKSSNSKVAFVDEYGYVTARKKGNAIISAVINKQPVKIKVAVE